MKKIKVYVFCRDKLVEWEIDSSQGRSIEFLLDKQTTLFSRNYKFHFSYDKDSYKLEARHEFELLYRDQSVNSKLIVDGDILVCNFPDERLKIALLIQFEDFYSSNFYKCKIDDVKSLTIGSNEDCDIVYPNENVLDYHITLNFKKHKAEVISNGVGSYINNRKFTKYDVKFGDVIFLYGLKCVYLGEYLGINNPKDNISSKLNFSDNQIEDLEPEKFIKFKPDLIGSEGVRLDLDEEKSVEFEPPVINKSVLPKLLYFGVIPIALVVLVLFSFAFGFKSGGYAVYISIGVCLALIGGCVLGVLHDKKSYEKQLDSYNNYLDDKFKEISLIKDERVRSLCRRYPKTIDCYENVINLSDSIWSRTSSSNDFLNLTIGYGNSYLDNIKIVSKKVSNLGDDHSLVKSYNSIISESRKINKTPVVIPIGEVSRLAVVGDMDRLYDVFKNFIVQLTSLSSPRDLKIMTISVKDHEKNIDYVKRIPHIYSDKNDFRYLSMSDEEFVDVFHYIKSVVKEREAILKENVNQSFDTSYVVFIFYAPNKSMDTMLHYIKNVHKRLKVSFVLLTIDKKNIPDSFKYVLDIEESEQTLYKFRENGVKKLELSHEYVDASNLIDIEKFAHVLSRLKVYNGDSSSGFENNSIFDLLSVKSIEELDVEGRWDKNKRLSSTNIPVSFTVNKEKFYLNIHEKQDGVNGIIFGECGVGKTEFLKSFILSYGVSLSPTLLNFIIVKSNHNLKLNFLINLPHVLDILDKDNLSEKNRLINLIKNEIGKRQRIFDSLKVNDINSYLNIYDTYSNASVMPHLVIVIDDANALDMDFIRELTNLHSSMMSVGIHIIVSSNDIKSFSHEEDVLSKFDFKISFRVQDSKDLFKVMGDKGVFNPKGTGKFNIKLSSQCIVNDLQVAFANNYTDDVVDQECIDVVNSCGVVGKKVIRGSESEESSLEQDEIVHAISNISRDINLENISIFNSSLRYLTLEDLSGYSSNFNGFMWNESKNDLSAIVGIIDDPRYQVQRFLSVNFKDVGNMFILGSPGTGKSTLIKTLIYSLCCKYKESRVNIYAVDTNTRNIDYFGYAPHVKNIAYTKAEVNSLFRKVWEEFEFRKKIFDNLDISTIDQYKTRVSDEFPYIILTIDSVQDLGDAMDDYMNFIRMIARDGKSYGIYVCITSSEYSNVEMNLCEYFDNKFVLRFNDETLYEKILGQDYKLDSKFKGRGILKYIDSLGSRILEFQVALPMGSVNDVDLNNKLKHLFVQMNEINNRIYGSSEIQEVLNDECEINKHLVEKNVHNLTKNLDDIVDEFINLTNNLCVVQDLSQSTHNTIKLLSSKLESRGLKPYFVMDDSVNEDNLKEFIEWVIEYKDERACVFIHNLEHLLSVCNDEIIDLLERFFKREFDGKMYFVVFMSKDTRIHERYSKVMDSILDEGMTIMLNEDSDEESFVLYKSEKISMVMN